MRPAVQRAVRLAGVVARATRRAGVTVLGYHGVGDDNELCIPLSTFVDQMDILAAHRDRCPVLSLDDASRELARRDGPFRAVVLTFDDAWANNHEHALRELVDRDLPATLYVPSRLLGRPGYMSCAQVLDMAAAGVSIGAHSRTHPNLRRAAAAELESEVRGSRDDLEDLIGASVTTFAYPTGLHDDRVVRAVAGAGYASAVTTCPGWLRPDTPPLRIPRGFVEDVAASTFAAGTRGGLNVLRPLVRLRMPAAAGR